MRGTTVSTWAVAGTALGLALFGCGGDETVASRSAAAFREAKQRGEPLGGDGHTHGPGALAPGGHHEEEQVAEHRAGAEEHEGHAASPAAHSPSHEGGHAAMGQPRAGRAGHAPGAAAARGAGAHAGHGAQPGAQAGHQVAATPPASGAHTGHAAAGASSPGAVAPLETAAAAEPGQPAETLAPDPVDAPAATSVAEAARSAALAHGMSAGQGHGHGTGTYRQQDAGRVPATAPPDEREHHDEPPAGDHSVDERRDGG